MTRIERPLLLFGANRPCCLIDSQLRLVRALSIGCFSCLAIVAGLQFLIALAPATELGLRITMLFAAALPGITLEHLLEKNARLGLKCPPDQEAVKVYCAEISQFFSVAIIASFVLEVMQGT